MYPRRYPYPQYPQQPVDRELSDMAQLPTNGVPSFSAPTPAGYNAPMAPPPSEDVRINIPGYDLEAQDPFFDPKPEPEGAWLKSLAYVGSVSGSIVKGVAGGIKGVAGGIANAASKLFE